MPPSLKTCTYLFLLLLTVHSQAQKKGYKVGYIMTSAGDTLNGLISDRSAEPFVSLYDQIRFKQKGKRRKKLSPHEIKGYQVSGNVFLSVAFTETQDLWRIRYVIADDSPKSFLKVIGTSDHLVLYHQEFVHDDNDFVDFVPLLHRPGSVHMVRATQGILGIKRKLLSEYFSDCPTLVDEINDPSSTLRSGHDIFDFFLEHCTWE